MLLSTYCVQSNNYFTNHFIKGYWFIKMPGIPYCYCILKKNVLISNFLKMQQKFRGSQEPVIANLVLISLINFKEKFQLDLLLVI